MATKKKAAKKSAVKKTAAKKAPAKSMKKAGKGAAKRSPLAALEARVKKLENRLDHALGGGPTGTEAK